MQLVLTSAEFERFCECLVQLIDSEGGIAVFSLDIYLAVYCIVLLLLVGLYSYSEEKW